MQGCKKFFKKALAIFKIFLTPSSLAMPVDIKNKTLKNLVRFIGWAIIICLPIYCLCLIEYLHFANKARFFTFFTERLPVVLFDLGVLYLIWINILNILKKGWIAVLTFSGFAGVISAVNYLKYSMTGDYFYPWDFQQASNVDELVNFITVPMPILYIGLIALGLLLAVPVFFSGASVPFKWYVRYPAVFLIVGVMLFSVSTPQKVTKLLNKSSLYLEDMALQTSNYSQNGFFGAFCVNTLSSNIQRPENYSKQTVDALIDGHNSTEASDDFNKPDIIVILSESFWDPTLLPGTTFSKDPLSEYRRLCEEENTISGRFFTTGFGGGTVRPEFEVLTGLTTDKLPSGCVPWQYITEETESYVSVYRELGYKTMAIHPYTSSFYHRKAAYPLIGIEELHFDDDLYTLGRNGAFDLLIRGKQIADETFAESIKYFMSLNEDVPNFVFGISMENHQPYPNKYEEHTITVSNPNFDENVLNAVTNFTEGVKNADACLAMLAEYVKNREKDTILVWFGDHLPTLGGGYGAYVQSGLLSDYDEEEYELLYSTPFLIYSNFELSESQILKAGKDNDITSYNLLNGVASLIGAPRTAYMSYLEAYAKEAPYYNIRLHKKVSDEARQYVDGHTLLTYDRVAGNRYSISD